MQYTENNQDKFCIHYIKFVNDYVQKILHFCKLKAVNLDPCSALNGCQEPFPVLPSDDEDNRGEDDYRKDGDNADEDNDREYGSIDYEDDDCEDYNRDDSDNDDENDDREHDNHEDGDNDDGDNDRKDDGVKIPEASPQA